MENTENAAFGLRIRELRKALNMTQNDFALKIGLTQNTITKYETGLRSASNQIVISICREFNVNEEWLREGKGDMFVEVSEDEQIAEFVGRTLSNKPETFRKRLILALSALDDDEWDLLEKILDKKKKKKE